MPFRGTGFIQPLPMALLTAVTVATMLWIVFTDDKKKAKKTKDVSRPRSPRTMMFPKVSFRDFANDSKVYCEEEDFEVIVLEKWVDKYDGPSSAYSRTRFPTESHDRPMIAESYSPAARQHRPDQPDRRPPMKFDPVATRSSIFGDAGFFASTQAMGDFYREKPATIVHRADSAEFLKRTKGEAGDNSRHSEEEEYVDTPGLPLPLFHDARGVPMSLGGDTFYDGEDTLEESIGGSVRSVVSSHRYRSLQLVASRITQMLKRPFLSRRSVLLMAILIFVLNDYSVSVSSFVSLLLLISLGQSLGGARKKVVSALEFCRFQYSFAISRSSILIYRLLESIGGAMRSVVSSHRYRSLQLVASRITQMLKRPFLSRRSVLLMAILIFVLNDYSVSVSSFVSLLLLISLGQSLGGARKKVVSALEYCRFQYSFAISRGSIPMYRLLESLEGAMRSVVSSHRYRSLHPACCQQDHTDAETSIPALSTNLSPVN
ncbi:uncharacterized protein [Branchiostoma lanceolatum]|uniref:uncharacterized protein n=1 Tax=Branchiostoma lanceolatum TaxID=7740 RepID=UPI0034549D81